ncbi:hypothetical protein [Devosia sp.]|uniref:hypothetical protein n=1 Tax=Devosia sp. TaxID=1871048 RepID=UPI0032652E37
MLGVSTYAPAFIASCQQQLDEELAKFNALIAAAKGTKAEAALAAFTPDYLKSMVQALDHMFMHRLRGKEGKDGNPCNEVRMLAVSILEHGGMMTADKTIKYVASKSVTGIAVGEAIVLTAESFGKLADAYFAEIAAKFM